MTIRNLWVHGQIEISITIVIHGVGDMVITTTYYIKYKIENINVLFVSTMKWQKWINRFYQILYFQVLVVAIHIIHNVCFIMLNQWKSKPCIPDFL